MGGAGEVGMVVCLWYYYTTLMGFNLNLTADFLSASSTRVAFQLYNIRNPAQWITSPNI